jgi:transposase
MAEVPVSFQSFVGVDLHKSTVSLAAVDRAGQVQGRLTIATKCVERIESFLRELPGPVHLAVEAVGFAEWFIDRFGPCVARIDIAHATALANLRGKRRKSDRNDALDIAVRLARGDCPLGWIADEATMQLRKLGRHWRCLSRTLSRAKHGLGSLLAAANLAGPKLEAAAGQKWFLAQGHLLKPVQRQAFANLLEIMGLIERQRALLRLQIIMANRQEKFAAGIELLRSLPGIDHVWACIILAEVGDFGRFPNADTIEFWAGLTADLKESAGRTTSGGITKAGSATLRWALGKAALTLCRSDGRQERLRQRLIARIGKPKANVAMARRLLRILYAMFRDGAAYQVQEPTGHAAQATAARLGKLRSQAA